MAMKVYFSAWRCSVPFFENIKFLQLQFNSYRSDAFLRNIWNAVTFLGSFYSKPVGNVNRAYVFHPNREVTVLRHSRLELASAGWEQHAPQLILRFIRSCSKNLKEITSIKKPTFCSIKFCKKVEVESVFPKNHVQNFTS